MNLGRCVMGLVLSIMIYINKILYARLHCVIRNIMSGYSRPSLETSTLHRPNHTFHARPLSMPCQ